MKAIDVLDFDIIKCGVEFVTGASPGVDDLLPHMELDSALALALALSPLPRVRERESLLETIRAHASAK